MPTDGDWPSPLPDSWVVFLGGEKTVFTAEIDVEEEKTMAGPWDGMNRYRLSSIDLEVRLVEGDERPIRLIIPGCAEVTLARTHAHELAAALMRAVFGRP